ncbi:lgrD [Symbiodinium sp. CCMP2592]|nr:lgrD [Symbiodinium sp. CCMP2592]
MPCCLRVVPTTPSTSGSRLRSCVHAVLLEGCAYNAFDVGEPVEKLRSWVEVSQPPIMITNESTMRRLNITNVAATLGGFPRMVLDVDLALRKASSTALPLRPAHAPEDLDRLAYLIFTSGSTGKPKAVMIRHKSALNVVRIWGRYVGLNEQDRFAQVASMSWDVHVIEVYGTMAARATSVTCPDLVKKSGPDMQVWLKEKQISGMSVVPSHLRTMAGGGAKDVSRTAAGLPDLRILDVGGEALGADVVDTWAPGRRLFNSYGPSEISVVCTGGYVQSGDAITIGAQLPTYDCYILDPETLEVKPEGERGVLFVGGIGLARGYLEEEEKTRQKFIELPGIGRVYNTGDLASRADDGRIHYHGRVDWQVKVRGIRIELEALEQAITELPAVKHCEARVLDGGQRLVLLASGSAELSEAELKATAAALGRGYVLSQVKVVENDAWKFNTSGKLLRNAVPLDAETADAEATKKDAWESFVKDGASELEREIAACLAPQLSNVEQWDCNSHFMEDLGVDSGGFGRLISQMRARPSLQQVDLQLLFEHPTVRSLAAALALSGDDSDSDHEGGAEIAEGLVHDFMARLEEMPHVICAESGCQSISYHQLSKLSASYQQLLHQRKHEPSGSGCVAICLELPGRLAAMLAAAREGRTFCILDSSSSDLSLLEQLRVAKPQMLLARRAEMAEARWTCLEQHCKLADVVCVDVGSPSLQSKMPKQRASAQVACIAFEETSDGLRALPASEAELQQASASWRLHVDRTTRVLCSLKAGSVGGLGVAWACLTAGATLLAPSEQLLQKLCVSRATILVCKPEDLEAASSEAGHARPETLSAVCLQDLGAEMPALRWAPSHLRVMRVGTAWTTAAPSLAPTPELRHGASMESAASRAWRAAGSSLSIASTLAGYVLGQTAEEPADSFGPNARPVLCATVQGAAILATWTQGHYVCRIGCLSRLCVTALSAKAQPVFVAARLVLAERVLLPLSFVLPLWGTFLLLLGLLFLEQFVRVGLLAATKWLLIGRYKEGEHDIYSLMYLRHWLAEHMAKGTIVGQNAHQGSSIAFLFMRNLALKALGANVSLSSVITARVVAFDLVTVGDLATVHGPRHLTAVNYGTRRMVLKRVRVGAGAYVGPNCTLEPGCEVAAAGYVEPLSTVSSGMVVDGRVCGVPAQPVAGADASRVPTPAEARRFRCAAAAFATGYWLLLLPKALVPLLGVFFLQLLSSDYPFNKPEQVEEHVMQSEHMDALPSQLFKMFCWVPLMAFGVSMINTIGQLFGTALLCRVLPKVKPPCTYSLVSIRAQIAALKMSMVLQASEMLADASIVPAFIRLCGATFGHGCAMGLQVTLPETLVVGNGCFFATGNILTSVDVDRGQFKVPCITYMSDHTFLGNHNHLPQGLPEGSFCGVGTWLPERPTEPNMSYFGNPAMKFRRLSSQAPAGAGKVNQGPEPASCLARFWHHFSTSILDVFLYRGVQGMVTAAAFVTSRVLVPDITGVGKAFEVLGIYIAFALGSWYVFSVLLGNLLFNGSAPRSNVSLPSSYEGFDTSQSQTAQYRPWPRTESEAYYSTTVTRWFTALTAQQRVFKLPFQTAGSRWQAPILRLLGAKVGRRFFCMNELVLVDAPFTEIGDDVTVDYDGQAAGRHAHTSSPAAQQDFRLKFTGYKIGNGVTIMSGASVTRQLLACRSRLQL